MDKKSQAELTADKIDATYWWVMKLDPTHPENAPNKEEITGYSKFQGHDEARDKIQLLLRKILMLVTNGYLERSNSIQIYRRKGEFVNKKEDDLILTLFPDQCKLEKIIMNAEHHPVALFLQRLYDRIVNNKPVDFLLPKRNPIFKKAEYLDVNKVTLKNQIALDNYCIRLVKNGHSMSEVIAFRERYMKKHPEWFSEDVTDPVPET